MKLFPPGLNSVVLLLLSEAAELPAAVMNSSQRPQQTQREDRLRQMFTVL